MEAIVFPLSLYLIGLLLMAAGNSLNFENETLKFILGAFKYGGDFIIQSFPLLLIISIIGTRHQSSVPVSGAILCYFLFNIVTMFASPQTYHSCYYLDIFGLQVNLSTIIGGTTVVRYPINCGIITSVIIIIIITRTYRRSRNRMNYGLLNFISNDTLFFINAIVETVLAALITSFLFEYLVSGIDALLLRISSNRTEPQYMFLYGIVERIMDIFRFDQVNKEYFWYGSLGGNFLDNNGATVLGDVSIWTSQVQNDNVLRGVGRFITPYYSLNCFIVPAVILALMLQGNNKIEKQKILGVGILAIISSLLCSSLVPLELLLVATAPLLLTIFVLISGGLYGLFEFSRIYLGFNYTGAVNYGYPGTLPELIYYLRRINYNPTAVKVVAISAIAAGILFVIVIIYYNLLAQNLTSSKNRYIERKMIIQCFGGYANIRFVRSSLNYLQIGVFNEEKVDTGRLLTETKVSRVIESAYGYNIEYGPGSIILSRRINRELKAFEGCEKYSRK